TVDDVHGAGAFAAFDPRSVSPEHHVSKSVAVDIAGARHLPGISRDRRPNLEPGIRHERCEAHRLEASLAKDEEARVHEEIGKAIAVDVAGSYDPRRAEG